MAKKTSLKLEEQLCFPLYAYSRYIVNQYNPLLKPIGLTYTQYLVLLVLWEKKTCQVGELGHLLHLDNGTLSPLLKKMESKELVVRSRSKQDERVVEITLTEKGKKIKDQVKNIPSQVLETLELSEIEVSVVQKLLDKIMK